MARYVGYVARGVRSGYNVSHANNKSKRSWKPNLQRVRGNFDGQVKPPFSLHRLHSFGSCEKSRLRVELHASDSTHMAAARY